METYNFYPASEFYRFRNRSCRNCEKRDRCRALKKDWSAQWLDMGRCGCLSYDGEFSNEIPIKKTI